MYTNILSNSVNCYNTENYIINLSMVIPRLLMYCLYVYNRYRESRFARPSGNRQINLEIFFKEY